jgi:hypothetical protein
VRLYVEAVALRGPGLDGWDDARAVLAGTEPYEACPTIVPPSPLLPANERRRAVQTVKLALALATEVFTAAGRDPEDTATIFTSSGGDGETLHAILEALASADPDISPTRFHNSVHNAPAGYWSIASGSHAPSTSLCCHDASFAAGLLEAAVQVTVDKQAVALIAYDLCYPEPLNSVRPISAPFGTAFLFTPAPTATVFARLDVSLGAGSAIAAPMEPASLEALCRGAPAARSLPLLATLARRSSEVLTLDYVPGLALTVAVRPVAAAGVAIRGQAAARA